MPIFTPDPINEQKTSSKRSKENKKLQEFKPSRIIGSLKAIQEKVGGLFGRVFTLEKNIETINKGLSGIESKSIKTQVFSNQLGEKVGGLLGRIFNVEKTTTNTSKEVINLQDKLLKTQTFSKFLEERIQNALSRMFVVEKNLTQTSKTVLAIKQSIKKHLSLIELLSGQFSRLNTRNHISEYLWSGTCILKLSKTTDTITATALNNAEAASIKRSVSLYVHTPQNEKVYFLNMVPSVVAGEVVVTQAVGAPTIVGTPTIVNGSVVIEYIFDTDNGSTKIYAADDIVTITCNLTVAGVSLPQVVHTVTVV